MSIERLIATAQRDIDNLQERIQNLQSQIEEQTTILIGWQAKLGLMVIDKTYLEADTRNPMRPAPRER